MKSYRQFISESYECRENLDEGLGRALAKGISYVTGKGVNPAAKVLNAVGGIYAIDRLQDTVRKGDRFGAYNAGAMLVPGMGPYSAGLKLGAIGLDALRQHRAMKAYQEKMKKKSEEPKEPLKPTHGSLEDYMKDQYAKDRYGY